MTEDAVSARSLADGPLKILFLGNVIPRKGLHTLVAALAPMGGTAWHLSVAGSHGRGRCLHESGENGRSDGQESGPTSPFTVRLPTSELPRLFAGSHVLAVPSSYEGFGIVYPEAMCFGLPVIASAAGGAEEVVEHGVNGFLVSPGDTAASPATCSELLVDRKRLSSMGLAALFGDSSRHPTWAETGGRIHEFLHDVWER